MSKQLWRELWGLIFKTTNQRFFFLLIDTGKKYFSAECSYESKISKQNLTKIEKESSAHEKGCEKYNAQMFLCY